MLCFKDKSFCSRSAECANKTCDRNFTDELHAQAQRWWDHDPGNAPVAFMDFNLKWGCFQKQ
jgi:hypothetical protein